MALCALSIYFAIKVEQRRRTWRQHKGEIDIKSGAAVTLRGVLDGDELSVRHEKRVFVVRLLGVRAFSPTINEPGIAHLGAQAAEALRATLREKKLTLHFKEKKRDKHKRLLAYLHADGKDVGFELVRRGLVLVYRRFAFAREPKYLAAELEVQRDKRGLWRSAKATMRATALEAAWQAQREEK